MLVVLLIRPRIRRASGQIEGPAMLIVTFATAPAAAFQLLGGREGFLLSEAEQP
jgi:hypothetical protein